MSTPVWGFPWHGRLSSPGFGPTLRIGDSGPELSLSDPVFPEGLQGALDQYAGGPFGTPPEEILSVHVVRVPGVPNLEFTPEEIADHTAKGRAWRNHALLCGSGLRLNGRELGGWVCIDSAGERWLIKPTGSPSLLFGNATIGSSLTLSFSVVPFGYIGQPPAAPITISGTLSDIQQGGETLGGEPRVRMRPASISSNGRVVIVALYPKGTSATTSDFACGWLRLELTGTGPSFAVSLTVIYSRTESLGVLESSDVDTIAGHWLTYDVPATAAGLTISGTCEGIGFYNPGLARDTWPIGRRTMISNRIGRILSLVFDEVDTLVTVTADLKWQRIQDWPTPTMQSATGTLSAAFSPGINTSTSTGSIAVEVLREGTDITTQEVIISRDGDVADSCHYEINQSVSEVVMMGINDPIPATLSPPQFITPSDYAPPYGSWSMVTTFELNGTDVYSYTNPAVEGGTTSWISHVWGVGASMDVSMDGPYNAGTYLLQRVSNQLIKAFHSVTNTSTLAALSKHTHAIVAARAIWNNPGAAVQDYSPNGCYNPVTHELTEHAVTAMHI